MTRERLTIPSAVADKAPAVVATIEDNPFGQTVAIGCAFEAELSISAASADAIVLDWVGETVRAALPALQDGAFNGLGMADRYAPLDGLLGRLNAAIGSDPELASMVSPRVHMRLQTLVTEVVSGA